MWLCNFCLICDRRVAKTGKRGDVVILVATSGDTAGALEGFGMCRHARLVFYPHGG